MSDLSRLLDDLYHDDAPTRSPSQSSFETFSREDTLMPETTFTPDDTWSSDDTVDTFEMLVETHDTVDTFEMLVETHDTDDTFVATHVAEPPERAPAWSSDEALDEVFASWVPGPSVDDTATQRSIVAGATFEDVFEPVITLEDMALTAPVAADRARWSPADDDILPSRRGRRRR